MTLVYQQESVDARPDPVAVSHPLPLQDDFTDWVETLNESYEARRPVTEFPFTRLASLAASSAVRQLECCICQTNVADAVLRPCEHSSICYACALSWLGGPKRRCPLCRRQVAGVLRVPRQQWDVLVTHFEADHFLAPGRPTPTVASPSPSSSPLTLRDQEQELLEAPASSCPLYPTSTQSAHAPPQQTPREPRTASRTPRK